MKKWLYSKEINYKTKNLSHENHAMYLSQYIFYNTFVPNYFT